jgi:hypothetical protein
MTVFAWLRMEFIGRELEKLQVELAPLLALARSCPPPGELAYVTFGMQGNTWGASTMHQAHESYAALCGLDTPVYDTNAYPHNMLSLRYKGAVPAPVTILVGPARWYTTPGLLTQFDYVLVHDWHPTGDERQAASTVADRVKVSGPWELWRRKQVDIPR